MLVYEIVTYSESAERLYGCRLTTMITLAKKGVTDYSTTP